jgi:hypothetical protein
MTEEQQLAAAVQTIIDANMDAAEISPAWVATEALAAIKFPRELHRLGYAGCHLELRQIARSKLRRQFDPINQAWEASAETDEEDLFPETLQDRYPRRPEKGQEPLYVLRVLMRRADVDYNVQRMRRAGRALLKHADALGAWGEDSLGERPAA